MADPQVNFFKSTLVGTYSDSDTSITIATGDGALLPDPSTDGAFNLTIFEGLQVTGSTEFEIVRVTARSGDVLTVTRGAESTTPLTIGSATHSILMSATKKTFDDINSSIENINLTTLSGVESITYDNTGDEVLQFPVGTTAQRPNSPATGYIRYNSDRESIEFYNGTNWLRLQSVEFNTLSLGVATATVTGNDATTLTNVIANAERLTFNSSGDESFSLPAGTEAQRPTASAGYMRYNTDEDVIEAYIDGEWVQLGSSGYPSFFGNRGLFAGGFDSSTFDTIDFVEIDTTGNATDFGDLTTASEKPASCSGDGRGLFSGGDTSGSGSLTNIINYVTIATTSNAIDFGDLTQSRNGHAGCSDGERGLFAGGNTGSSVNTIDFVSIDTTSNATDFGDLSVARKTLSSTSNGVRGVFGGGADSSPVNTIDYVTIATTGNATDFGDLSQARRNLASCSDGTRGLFGGGNDGSRVNTIDYITIDTTGNAVDFGDLTSSRDLLASCSNATRGLFGGGIVSSVVNTIEFVTVQTTGNASDFGDLTVSRRNLTACSGD
jgi:hypothetical protein